MSGRNEFYEEQTGAFDPAFNMEKADFMGQGFADELFRVFAAQHPYK